MKNKTLKNFLFGLCTVGLFLTPRPARAENDLTLEECFDIAGVRSPVLDEAKAEADLYKWQATEKLSGFLPSLSARGQWYFHERFPTFDANFAGRSFTNPPVLGNLEDVEFSLRVPIFDGFRNIDAYEAAVKTSRAAQLDSDWANFQTRQQIRLAYFSVLSARETATAASQNVKDLQDHRRIVHDQLRAGVTTQVALLRIDTQLANAESEFTNANDEIAIRTRQLAQLLGEDEESRSVNGTLPIPTDGTLQAIESAKPGVREDIQALDLRSVAAAQSHQAAAKWWVPQVSFLGSYDLIRAEGIHVDYFALGLGANWNLFDGMASISKSKEAAEMARIAERRHEQSALQSRTDFETYRRRYKYNLQKYQAYGEDLKRSAESVRLARAALRAGSQTNTDVLDAEQDLFNSRSREIEAQYGALEALVRFELALGRNVSL